MSNFKAFAAGQPLSEKIRKRLFVFFYPTAKRL